MKPATLITNALEAGLTEGVSQELKEACMELIPLVRQHLTGKPMAEYVLAEYEADRATWAKPLQKKLLESGATQDQNILQKAQYIMKLAQQASQGKYNTQITHSKGIAVGDHARIYIRSND